MRTTEEPAPQLVEAFVLAAHGAAAKVRALHRAHPALLNARYAKFNETALAAAGHMGNREIAVYLLDAGAPPTIFAAAMLGRAERVAAFLDADPALARADGVHGISILYHAALSGRPEIAKLLVARGGGRGADRALHAAVKSGAPAMVTWLLARGVAEVNVADFAGKTPLRAAIERGAGGIAALLRRHGGRE